PPTESAPKVDGQITSEPAPPSREPAVSITETAARTVDLELYETPDFSIQIPKGWTVTSGGTGMYHSIRIQDPAEPLNQMFVLLKADILLHSQEGKDASSESTRLNSSHVSISYAVYCLKKQHTPLAA